MKNNSHLTAISRKTLPLPVQWLLDHDMINGFVLDYGCGKCSSVNSRFLAPQVESLISYDPFHTPDVVLPPFDPRGWFTTILCTYVLCVLKKKEADEVLQFIQSFLKPKGNAFITVRNAAPKQGWGHSCKGTYQRKVELPNLELIREVTGYRIYRMNKDSKI